MKDRKENITLLKKWLNDKAPNRNAQPASPKPTSTGMQKPAK